MNTHFLFSSESWLWAMPAVGVFAAALWALSAHMRRKRLARFITLARAEEGMRFANSQRRIPFLLTLGTLLLLILALARPLTGPRPGSAERSGVNLVILLDISKSMLVRDVDPNRLRAVKKELRAWLKTTAGDAISVVPFAGDAFVMAPLTFDYQALDFVIDAVGPHSISAGGSNLPVAMETAGELLANASDGPRVILLISDGENLEGDAVKVARQLHSREQITVLTLGVGTYQGGKVPNHDEETVAEMDPEKRPTIAFVRNEYGTWVNSRFDERTLRAIAEAAGGKFYRFEPGVDTFRSLQNQSLRPLARKAASQHIEVADYDEWFQIPLMGAVLLMLAGSGLNLLRRKPVAKSTGVSVIQPENFSAAAPNQNTP